MDDVPDLQDRCEWPVLPSPFGEALREAVEFVLARFQAVGLVAAGTILAGTPDPHSDLDIHVIHTEAFRQRIQKRFRDVPAEIFVNPVASVLRYFQDELSDARPSTAHMFFTGFVVLDTDGVVGDLRRRAAEVLGGRSLTDESALVRSRYHAATLYEDAVDVVDRDAATANMVVARAVDMMIDHYFRMSGLFIPRSKELIQTVCRIRPDLGDLLRRFLLASDAHLRVELAGEIADLTIGVRGFFEWESAAAEVK